MKLDCSLRKRSSFSCAPLKCPVLKNKRILFNDTTDNSNNDDNNKKIQTKTNEETDKEKKGGEKARFTNNKQ